MKWTKKDKKELKVDFFILSKEELERKYKRKYILLINLVNKMGIYRYNKTGIITKEKIEEFTQDYISLSEKDLEKKYKRSFLTLQKKFSKLKLNIRRNYKSDKFYKLKINQINKKCKKRNYTFLGFVDGAYKNSKSKLKLKCNKDNYIWEISYNRFIYYKFGCPKCVKSFKITLNQANIQINNKCNKKNYTFLGFVDGAYKNSKSKLKLKCNKDNFIWITSYNYFIKKGSCQKCVNKNKKSNDEIISLIKDKCLEKNYTFLGFADGEYKSNISKLILRCNRDNYEWRITYNKFINCNRGCSKCSKKYKKTTSEAIDIINNSCKEKNCSFLGFVDKEYRNIYSKLKLKCNKDNNIWVAVYNSFINHDTGCPICKESKNERLITNFLIYKHILYIREKRFKECKNINKLPFDFYLPDYNICIEFDGIQHFKITGWNTKENLENIQIRDAIKTKFCEDNNIKLLRINYKENVIEKLEEFLNIKS